MLPIIFPPGLNFKTEAYKSGGGIAALIENSCWQKIIYVATRFSIMPQQQREPVLVGEQFL